MSAAALNYQEFQDVTYKIRQTKIPPKFQNTFIQFYKTLKISNVDIDDFTTSLRVKHYSLPVLQTKLINYIIEKKLYNFSAVWYIDIVRTMQEVHLRYTGKSIYRRNTLTTYRDVFHLYCKLYLESIYTGYDTFELLKFVIAQYSYRSTHEQGVLTQMSARIFSFPSSFEYYQNISRYKIMPACTLSSNKNYLYTYPKKQDLEIPDLQCGPFLGIEFPILKGEIPKLNQYNKVQLLDRIRKLEYLKERALFWHRPYNHLLLSIEHFRSFVHAQREHPSIFDH